MKLITLNPNKYNEEVNRFNESVRLLQKIFSTNYTNKFTEELDDKIGSVIVFDRTLIGGGYYGDSNIIDGRFVIRYGTTDDKYSNYFITLHELCHVLITPINRGEVDVQGTSESSQGITKFDSKENKFYGLSLTEAFCNIIPKIAILNKKHESIDNYFDTGLKDYVYNYYSPFEDITRLLILASKNDYLVKYSFDDVVDNDGIDTYINEPVNKPFSIFISSTLNNDFAMENNFDMFTKKGEFRSMCEDLDEEILRIKISNNIEMPKYNLDVFENQIVRIETYYFNRLLYLAQKDRLNSLDDRDKLFSSFEEICDSIRVKLKALNK